MAEKQAVAERPKVLYRLELEKRIQINKSYSERRNQAIALRILSYGLYGQKRYQHLYLTCSLNCFYYALKIANSLHQRVIGLAMVIKFETVQIVQFYEKDYNGKNYAQKKYTKIHIKLTKNPSQQDQKQPGYHPGLDAKEIPQPLTDVIIRKKRQPNDKSFRDKRPFNRRNDRDRFRRYDRRDYRDNQRGYRRDYGGGYQMDDRNRHPQYLNTKRYGDDRDERRYYRKSRQEELKDDDYKRGQKHTRGTRTRPLAQGDRRPHNDRQPDDKEGRGARMPRKRYQDD